MTWLVAVLTVWMQDRRDWMTAATFSPFIHLQKAPAAPAETWARDPFSMIQVLQHSRSKGNLWVKLTSFTAKIGTISNNNKKNALPFSSIQLQTLDCTGCFELLISILSKGFAVNDMRFIVKVRGYATIWISGFIQHSRLLAINLRLHVITLKWEGWTTWEPKEPYSPPLPKNLEPPSKEMHGTHNG